MTTARGGTRNWSAVTRVGPEQLHAVEDDDVGEAGRHRARVDDREDDRRAEPDRSAVASWAMPSGAMNRVPATIAQVVATSGEWRRRIRAPKTGRRAQHAAAPSVSRSPTSDDAEVDALAGGDHERRRRRTR